MTEPPQSPPRDDVGEGVELSATQARGATPRRGMMSVLALSALAAIVAIGVIWLVTARLFAARPAPGPPDTLPSRAQALRTLGPDAVQKCAAFRRLIDRTRRDQAGGGGDISASERKSLQDALEAAQALPPASLTPVQCGVPL